MISKNRFSSRIRGIAVLLLLLVALPVPAMGQDEKEAQKQEREAPQIQPPEFPPDENWDSMPRILEEQRRIVSRSSNLELVGRAAGIIWQTHHMSGLVVLPTAGVEETFEMHRNHVQQLEVSIRVLDERLGRGPQLPAAAAQSVLEVKVSLEAEIDWTQTIGRWTAEIRPNTPQAKHLQKRQLRSPFIPIPILKTHGPEEVVTEDVIGINECMVVVKEIQGMKVRLVAKLLPIWIEPWFSRRKIVGFKIVWCVEYVPAQFIKKIITCNDCCNKIKNEVFTEIIEHPELLNFWRYFKKGHYPKDGKY